MNVQPTGYFKLSIATGPDQGASYAITQPRVKIGRSAQNDIVLTDPKVSREHAILNLKNNGLYIQGSGGKKIIINGHELDNGILAPGSQVTIGETVFSVSLEVHQAPVASTYKNLNQQQASPDFSAAEPEKSKLFFYIILGLVVVVGILLSQSGSKDDEEFIFRDDEAIQEEILNLEQRKDELKREYYNSGRNSQQYIQAQSNYKQGFREYREANYKRSINYFTAALSQFPNHKLAERYLVQAQRKLEEEIQTSLARGNSLKEQGKYRQAVAEYRHVLILVSDKTSVAFKEATSLMEECILKLKIKGGSL
ncbi:MAG: FHA domain-containing protein [Bdellovibrionales bacterium]